MTTAQIIRKEMMVVSRSDKERDKLRKIFAQMSNGTIKPERLKIILTSLGYIQTKPGYWNLYTNKNENN